MLLISGSVLGNAQNVFFQAAIATAARSLRFLRLSDKHHGDAVTDRIYKSTFGIGALQAFLILRDR